MKQTLVGLALAALVGCGGTSAPTAPTGPPPPVNIAGNWTGNMASNNWPLQAVVMTLSQSGTSVNGTWTTSTGWDGQVTGTVDTSSFTGTFTLSAPNALGVGQRCTGTASISGSAGATLHWSGAGFTGTCNGEPLNVTFTLQRN